MREETLAQVIDAKVIAIVRGQAPEVIANLAQALFEGGIRLVEITFDQAHPERWPQTAAAIALIREKFAHRLLPGAGTVMTVRQLSMAADAGARYIISPNMDPLIINGTKRLGLLSFPGAMTPTEIAEAYANGADAVKVFPANALGPGYIKAIRAPMSHIPLMAVGGVNEKNAGEYLAAGCVAVGAGGNLINKDWIAAGAWDKITALAREYGKAVGN